MSFTVYKSSAGSGKTFTLAKEYLKLVLTAPEKYKTIIAITFTNKAAAEMKERILLFLKELSITDVSTYSKSSVVLIEQLIHETKISEKTIHQNAEKVLSDILHNYSDFSISTIDSFVHRVIKSFAFELKIPFDFEVELDSDALLTKVIDLLINKVGDNLSLTKVLIDFTESKTDDESNWNIENDLFKIAKLLLNPENDFPLKSLKTLNIQDFYTVRKNIISFISQLENDLQNIGKKGWKLITNSGLQIEDFNGGNRGGIGKYFKTLSENAVDFEVAGGKIVNDTIAGNWYKKTSSQNTKTAIDGISQQLETFYFELNALYSSKKSDYIVFNILLKDLYSLAVLNEIEKLLQDYKTQNNILHISEFNKRLSEVVLSEPVPFIYEHVGIKYQHYLIDEFQDTSITQWQNLLPLLENTLASGNFNMIVGDGKQSIYRWRGGSVEQFNTLPEIYKHENNPHTLNRQATLIQHYEAKDLVNNWRSKKEIIDFNNDFFSTVPTLLSPELKSIYEGKTDKLGVLTGGVNQIANPNNTGGYISIELVSNDNNSEEHENPMVLKVIEQIELLIKEGFKHKDIAILCRENKKASIIANALSDKGYDVITPDSLLISNSEKIKLIVAFLYFLSNNDDPLNKAEVLYLISNENKKLHSYFSQCTKAGEFEKTLNNLGYAISVNEYNNLPLYELVEKIIRLFKLNNESDSYLISFLDLIHSYAQNNSNEILGFVEWWEINKTKKSISVPDGIDAVQVMSIHKSKGLQFPIVIFPFADWNITDTKRTSLWFQIDKKETGKLKNVLLPATKNMGETEFAEQVLEEKNRMLLDNINLLYVAMTRPESRLYIYCKYSDKPIDKMTSIADIIIYYLKDKNLFTNQNLIYEFGIKSNERPTKPSKFNRFNPQLLLCNKWKDRIILKPSAESQELSDSNTSKKEWGIIVHESLSKIQTKDDIEYAAKSMISNGSITSDQLELLSSTLLNIIEKDELKPFFKMGLTAWNEKEIVTEDHKIFRPDRLIISDKKASIIEYKTGEEDKKHIEQLNHYSELLEKSGFNVKDKFLVYTENLKIINIAPQ